MNARAEASRKMEISAFLQSWGPLRKKLGELAECEQAALDAMLQSSLKTNDLDELNKHILQRAAIKMVFNLVEELREDLHGDEPSTDSEAE